jgi:two component transcriptional regulator, winged helix family
MPQKTRILLVEDDASLGYVIKDSLEERGFEVTHAIDGNIGWQQFSKHFYDLILLDVMMPHKDGFTLAAQIRRKNTHIPILFITAKSMQEDKIAGFKAGGDDYITKPFSMEELMLRIDVFLKRTKGPNQDELIFLIGKTEFDFPNLTVKGPKTNVRLTQKEADLLRFFCLNPNRVVKREEVLTKVWGKDDYFLGRSMDVFITKIRKYLKDETDIEIQTIHGVGFRFINPSAKEKTEK